MPAQSLSRTLEKESYFHVYNKGIENKVIFKDEGDYEIFISFLDNYLSTPQDSNRFKKVFNIKGRSYRGLPHQPKNYFDKVVLIAYNLTPNSFHLILNQKAHGAIERFIRSLCTRYSIYFNKKYHRNGTLFEGPYRSIRIKDSSQLLDLTVYLHSKLNDHGPAPPQSYSSYAEYIGSKVTSWVKPEVVLATIDNKPGYYKDLVEKYNPDQEGDKLAYALTFDAKSRKLERSDLASSEVSIEQESNVKTENTILQEYLKPSQRVPEFLAAMAMFSILFYIGISRIVVAPTNNPTSTPSPPTQVLSNQVQVTEEKIQVLGVVEVVAGTENVNIRSEPTLNSKKVAKTKSGDRYEFIYEDANWYGVKLKDNSNGYISAKLVKKIRTID